MGKSNIGSIIGLIAIVVSIMVCAGVFTENKTLRLPSKQVEPNKPRPAPPPKPKLSPEDVQALEQTVQALKALRWIDGAPIVHSVDVEQGIVRYHLAFWLILPLEKKQEAVRLFLAYFMSKGKSERVEILSDENDQKLATYDVWHGIRILV